MPTHRETLAEVHLTSLGEAFPRPYQDGESITENPDCGRIVCHCERITRAELAAACHAPGPRNLRGHSKLHPDAATIFHQNNFNFTGALILLSALALWLYWELSAKKWFTGPKVQGTREELLAIERELDAVGSGQPALPPDAVPAPRPG